MSDTIVKDDSFIDESEIGRRFLFWAKEFADDEVLGFASKIENIGIVEKHDCRLKNKTEVIALSEPTEARHATKGPILVTKILAHEVMWVHTWALHEIKE